MIGRAARQSGAETSDLHSQLEDLLDEVWREEADWKLNDRLDLAARMNATEDIKSQVS